MFALHYCNPLTAIDTILREVLERNRRSIGDTFEMLLKYF